MAQRVTLDDNLLSLIKPVLDEFEREFRLSLAVQVWRHVDCSLQIHIQWLM